MYTTSTDTLIPTPSDIEEACQPCTSEAGAIWEREHRPTDPVWAGATTYRSYAARFSSRVKLQPPACAPDYILPTSMAGKPYTRWIPDPNKTYDFVHHLLKCAAHNSVEHGHDLAVAPFLWEPILWECRHASERGHPTLLFRLRSKTQETWGLCTSCGIRRGGLRLRCDAFQHFMVDPPGYVPNLEKIPFVGPRQSTRNAGTAVNDANQAVPVEAGVQSEDSDLSDPPPVTRKPGRARRITDSKRSSQKRKRLPELEASADHLKRYRSREPSSSDGASSEEEWQRIHASAVSSSSDIENRPHSPKDEDVKIPVEELGGAAEPVNAVDTSIANLNNVQSTLRQLHTATQMKDLRIHQLQQALLASGHRPDLVIPQEYDMGLPARPLERLSAADEEAWRALDAARPA